MDKMWCFVTQPNSVVLEVELDPKAKGEELLDKVCQQLGIVEVDYFGLQYAGAKGEQLWINVRNRISRQLCGSAPYRLRLRVKFFVEPHYLLQETTRHQFFLQLRQDFYEDKLKIPDGEESTVAQITALIAQVEVGDHKDHPSMAACYSALVPARYRDPESHPDFLSSVDAEHRKMVGTPKQTAEYKMLKAVSKLECYGMEYHMVKNNEGLSLHIGVGPEGVSIYDPTWKLIKSIPYPTVKKVIHSGKSLFVYTLKDDGSTTTLQFKLVTEKSANALYRSVTEMHSFYRCDTVRRAVASQVSRDLKGTLASLFNENSTAGTMYEFDIQRTFIEAYDHARRKLYATGSSISLPSSPTHNLSLLSKSGFETTSSTINLCDTEECQRLKSQLDRFQDELLCRVCMDSQVDTVFCPCGHLACCTHCADRVDSCPLCRGPIEKTQRIFLPSLRLPVS